MKDIRIERKKEIERIRNRKGVKERTESVTAQRKEIDIQMLRGKTKRREFKKNNKKWKKY